jgi:hypothetical protein
MEEPPSEIEARIPKCKFLSAARPCMMTFHAAEMDGISIA